MGSKSKGNGARSTSAGTAGGARGSSRRATPAEEVFEEDLEEGFFARLWSVLPFTGAADDDDAEYDDEYEYEDEYEDEYDDEDDEAYAEPGGLPPRVRTALVATVLVATGVALALAVPPMRERVRQASARTATAPPAVVLDDLPDWVARTNLAEHLERIARGSVAGDPYDREELRLVASSLEGSGWYDEVEQVRRHADGTVEVTGTLVEPFAVVRDGAADHLVDRHGRLLPRTFAAGEARGFISVVGGRTPPPGDYRTPWEGEAVAAGLELLARLAVEPSARPWLEQVAEIDVARWPYDRTLLLRTDIGAEIEWGSLPGRERPLEPGVDRKLAFLAKAVETTSRIDCHYPSRWYFHEGRFMHEHVALR